MERSKWRIGKPTISLCIKDFLKTCEEDDKLQDIVESVESPKPPNCTTLQVVFRYSLVSVKDATTNSDVEMTAHNGHSAQNGKNGNIERKDSEAMPDCVADAHVGAFMWWLGFDIHWNWRWRQRAHKSKKAMTSVARIGDGAKKE